MRNRLVILACVFLVLVVALSTGAAKGAPARQSGSPTLTPTPGPSASATAAPVASTTPPPGGGRFFQETGFTVPDVFVKYWDTHGGLAVFGYPISEARVERNLSDGKSYTVQYFERNRFEFHPEFKDTPNEVLLGLLGVELTRGRTFDTSPPFTDSDTRIYMEPTKHSLGEPFLSYWRNNGGLGIFGYPISEPFDEKSPTDGKTYLVQYFERNRFEFHPENKPPYDVLLGLLGKDYMEVQDALNAWGTPVPGGPKPVDPLWVPVKPAIGGKFLQGPLVGDGMIVQAYYQDRERILNMVNTIKFGWIKQQIEWKDTEDPKGTYFFDELDNVVNSAQAHNVNVLVTVVKAPTWATGGFNGYPKDPKDMGDFMRALAAHFKGRVAAYEIWNEENLAGETGEVNAGRYVELLKQAYLAVKSVDPSAAVITGAMAPTGVDDPLGKRAPGAMGVANDLTFLEQMFQYQNGEVRKYYDALGSHPYGFNNPPDTGWPDNPNWNPSFPVDASGRPNYYNTHNSFYFRRIEDQRAIMEKYGDGQKQMWVTEYGWCTDFRPDGYGECKYNTPDQQGQYILGAQQRARKYYPWMGPMFLWNLNFSTFQEWFTGPSHFSILNPDWTPRPAFVLLQNRLPPR